MNRLEKHLIKNTNDKVFSTFSPKIFDFSKKKDQKELNKLFEVGKIVHVIDGYKDQLSEYFEVSNPDIVYSSNFKKKLRKYIKEEEERLLLREQGRWVYYPWFSLLVHIMEEEPFFLTRTSRNRNLITKDEQEKFYNSSIGIVGLSIGNSIALTLALKGGAKNLKLADYDRLELSNLNRIRTGVHNLGLYKTHLTAREIYMINPYANIEINNEGLNKENIEDFFEGLDIIIDEIDDFPTKVLIREYAKKKKVPVITSIDNSDGSVLEIERYDKNPQPKPFHGRIKKITYKEAQKMSKMDVGKLIANHVGMENIEERMQRSFLEIGKSVVSWPQLGGSALLNGALVSYCVRKILIGEDVKDRTVVSFDELLLSQEISKSEKKMRTNNAKKLFS